MYINKTDLQIQAQLQNKREKINKENKEKENKRVRKKKNIRMNKCTILRL